MLRWAMLGMALATACACSSTPVHIDSRPLGDQVSQPAERFIIVAVENEPAAFVAHAGSTPRGYDAAVDYGPTTQAREVLRSLEQE